MKLCMYMYANLFSYLQERRIQAIREIFRVLKPSGSALIYAWAKDQEINCQPSTYLNPSSASTENEISGKKPDTDDQQLTSTLTSTNTGSQI